MTWKRRVLEALAAVEKGDLDGAIFSMKRLERESCPDALLLYAILLEEGVPDKIEADPARAVSIYRQLAREGNDAAVSRLAQLYFKGHIVERDYESAYWYYLPLAEGGYSVAQFVIGYMYHRGLYVDQDLDVALEWMDAAAGSGHLLAKGIAGGIRATSGHFFSGMSTVLATGLKILLTRLRDRHSERIQRL